jgi:hypothetical protein
MSNIIGSHAVGTIPGSSAYLAAFPLRIPMVFNAASMWVPNRLMAAFAAGVADYQVR